MFQGVRKILTHIMIEHDEELATSTSPSRPYSGPLPVDAAPDAACLAVIASAGSMCHQLGSPIRRWHR